MLQATHYKSTTTRGVKDVLHSRNNQDEATNQRPNYQQQENDHTLLSKLIVPLIDIFEIIPIDSLHEFDSITLQYFASLAFQTDSEFMQFNVCLLESISTKLLKGIVFSHIIFLGDSTAGWSIHVVPQRLPAL